MTMALYILTIVESYTGPNIKVWGSATRHWRDADQLVETSVQKRDSMVAQMVGGKTA